MAHLSKILLYPIKALDAVEVAGAAVRRSGGLQHDREFAMLDAEGRIVNGKRKAEVHRLRSQFDLSAGTISVRRADANGSPTQQFSLRKDRGELGQWLSGFFGFDVRIAQDHEVGFPDDADASGPTLISTATLETVASWFPGLGVENVRQRFRANLEIGGVPAFWEDQLYGDKGQTVTFRLGDVLVEGVNPCQRCIVPTRDPQTGEATEGFQKTFMTRRKESLPEWANVGRFDHFYRLCVNTRIPSSEVGKKIKIGNRIQLLK